MPTFGPEGGPKACGHLVRRGKAQASWPVFRIGGRIPGLRRASWSAAPEDALLVYDPEGSATRVRPIQPKEVWCAKDGHLGVWSKAINDEGADPEVLAAAALREPTTGLATSVAAWALQTAQEQRLGQRAGVCSCPGEDAIWGAMRRWLEAWKRHGLMRGAFRKVARRDELARGLEARWVGQ